MSHLLRILRLKSKAMQNTVKGKKPIPLILEWAVNEVTAPYLVSSTAAIMWIEDPHEGNLIRAAIRPVPDPGVLFKEILDAVAKRGRDDEWGNVHPYTAQGLKAAIDHVQYYDLEEIEILVPKKTKTQQRPEWLNKDLGYPLKPTSWLPDDCAVVVPKDRDFVGILGYLDAKNAAAVVHNASRGIGVAWGA